MIPEDKLNGTWVWPTLNVGREAPTGQQSGFRGVYSIFNIIEDMGNGQSALVVVV